MRLRSGQPCARSYHSIGTQEYRLCIPVFRNTGSRRSRSGERPNKSLTRSITSFWSSGYRGTAVATANRRGTASIESTLSPETGSRNAERKATLCTWRFCRGGDPPGAIETRNRSSPVRTAFQILAIASVGGCTTAPERVAKRMQTPSAPRRQALGLRSSRPRSRSSFFSTFDYAVRLGNMAGSIFELSLGEQGLTISRLQTPTYLLR